MGHRKQAWSKRVKKERFKKKYLTRMQATRLLQLDSMHFRRLCILKGIYPRALARSKQKQSGNEKQYYLAREIRWLVHDQLTQRMMALRAWERKVKRAEAMGRQDDLKTLHSPAVKPRHSLVATIKERYPYFVDAVRDVDDAMSLIALYAFLTPEVRSDSTVELHHALTSGMHERARAMCAQWNAYISGAKLLTKAFISVKGYYFEAIVRGVRVRWLCPHEYAHAFPSGIQQYILLSFLEFYLELMKFVLYKLNADLQRDRDEEAEAEAERLQLQQEQQQHMVADGHGVTLSSAATAAATATGLDEEGNDRDATAVAADFQADAVASMTAPDATQAQRQQAKEQASVTTLQQQELARVRRVFAGLTFYLSREVPSKHARLIIESAGGRVATEYVLEHLTHVVVDRPTLPPGMVRSDHVEYVQPQYLFDCLNARALLPVNGYRMGEELPPHVSPFTVAISNRPEDVAAVEATRKDHPRLVSYVPERVHEVRKLLDPTYTPIDPEGKVARERLARQEAGLDSDDDEEGADGVAGAGGATSAVRQLDAADDVALSDDELAAARRRPAWEEEQVTEEVARSTLSALKVQKQRALNLMNAPTSEVVARRRQALLKAQESKRLSESGEARVRRRLREMARQEAATRKMQLQVVRKKAARYYKMVNGVVTGAAKKAQLLQAKATQLQEGKLQRSTDGGALVNARVASKRARAQARHGGDAASTRKPRASSASNPYRKLPKWVQ